MLVVTNVPRFRHNPGSRLYFVLFNCETLAKTVKASKPSLDETYSHDGLNRLIGNDRATGNDQTCDLYTLGNIGNRIWLSW